MAVSIQYSRWLSSTTAEFREWGKAISDGIEAVGLTRGTDAGQIDWETVILPTVTLGINGVVAGFEIWHFNDALQAERPVVIKLEYGAGATGGNIYQPGMWVTIGRATDGAGRVQGVLAPRRLFRAASGGFGIGAGVNTGETEPVHISSDGSSLCVAPRTRNGNSPTGLRVGAFIIDRSRDHAGNPTATGGVIIVEGQGSIASAPSGNITPANLHAWTYAGDFTMGEVPAVLPQQVNGTTPIGADVSLAAGDKAPVFPYVVVVPNHEPWQVLAAVATPAGDAPNGVFTAVTLGRERTYRSIPVTDSHNRWMAGSTGGYSGLCILWEDDNG